MRSLAQVLEAWQSGLITANEAVEMSGARDVAHLKVLADPHGARIAGSSEARRRPAARRQPFEQRPPSQA
jgi:hypothetical protein